jgi:hypothetical protein
LSHLGSGSNQNDDSDNDDVLLKSLPSDAGAEYNAYAHADEATCHGGTCVALLDEIMAWTAAHDARRVFWLNRLASTGKSTIVRTAGRRCADAQRLGASFFFTRGGGNLASARKFVTTVARELAEAVPPLRPHICAAARRAGGIAAKALQDQWARLVPDPVAKAKVGLWGLLFRQPLVVVVDALNECNRQSEAAAILGLLALGGPAKQSWLRVLLTSRPKIAIRHGIEDILLANRDYLILHHIDPPVVDRDISVYFTHNLCLVGRERLHDFEWPSDKTLMQLVKRAGGLFIWAATGYRFN